MKTLILIDGLIPGGLEQMLLEWVRHRSKDHQIIVVAIYNLGHIYEQLRSENVGLEFLDIKAQGLNGAFYKLKEIVLREKPDTALCLRGGARALFPRFLRRLKVPRVVLRWDNPQILRTLQQYIMERFQLHYATGLQACSQTVADSLKRHYGNRKIDVVPNGIEVKRFDVPHPVKREGPFQIISVGNLRKEKRQDHQLHIASELKHRGLKFQLKIVGDGPLSSRLKNQIEKDGLQDVVLLMGQSQQIPQLLASSDLFLFTSKHEGFGIAIVEAMAAGLPCVLYDLPVLKEIDPNREAFRVIPNGKVDLAVDAIIELAENPDKRAQLGSQAKQLVSERFSIEAVTREWERALYEIDHDQ
jgi:GalNAc-alpha-(1->4)-GalNAc-alpha-(1->3)-diNAcBac-PP-undecaprenol alpha-1,4-N-acetyl-D-galactosaminyltransferase